MGMGWLLLGCGIIINVSGVVLIKLSQQVGQPLLGLAGYLAYFIGFLIISLSFNYLEVGFAYALWSGVGSLLVLGCGVLLFKESFSVSKLLFFALIMMGVLGLSLSSYLDAAGETIFLKLTRMSDAQALRFGRYFVGFAVLSCLILGNPSQATSSSLKEGSFILGSLVAILVMSLVLVLFLVFLYLGVALWMALGISAALWFALMLMFIPVQQNA